MNENRSPPASAPAKPSKDVPVDPDQLPHTLEQCRRCSLWHDATQGVAGEGSPRARIMVVGEQPGDKEDLAGKPFVGPAGRLLESAFQQAGVQRETTFLTNAVKHFKWEPRGKRRMHKTPAQREIEACRYWLEKEIRDVGPRVIVTLGATALKAVLQGMHVPLHDVIGRVIDHEGLAVVPTYHPSYALRATDEQSRAQAYEAIVDALRSAGTLSRSKRGRSPPA